MYFLNEFFFIRLSNRYRRLKLRIALSFDRHLFFSSVFQAGYNVTCQNLDPDFLKAVLKKLNRPTIEVEYFLKNLFPFLEYLLFFNPRETPTRGNEETNSYSR
jgi:hypothetical protein